MSLDGGVTNYYRQLALDAAPEIDYFPVNAASARGLVDKLRFLSTNYFRYYKALAAFDGVHVNPSLNPKSFYRDAVYVALARSRGKVVLVTFHGWSYDFEKRLLASKWRRALFRATFGKVRAIVVLGRTFEQRLAQLGLPADVPVFVETTIADDVDFDALEAAARKAERGTINFLFLARAIREKGLFIALEAFARCRALLENTPMHLFVAGDGPDLAEARRRYGDRDDVSFLGHIDDAQRRKLLNACHVLLFPTYHGEGLPCTILEAMLYGLPVLTRPEGAISEIVEDGRHGLVTTSREPATFAEYAARLVREPELFDTISRRNMQKADVEFRTAVVRKRLLRIYREVFGGDFARSLT